MTSKDECFIYIALPGEQTPITAAKYRLEKDRHGTPTGHLVYGKTYLTRNNRVPLDPVELVLQPTTYHSGRLGGSFGALRDACPDAWGRKVIEWFTGRTDLSELDYMLKSPHDRPGAISFGTSLASPAPPPAFNRTMDLSRLIALSEKIIAADRDPTARLPEGNEAEQVERILLGGTSMGGARPKATVRDPEGLWLAKFAHRDDRWNNPRVEHAMMSLAAASGLHCAETKVMNVGGRDVLLVRRFDRSKEPDGTESKRRMISGLTLLNIDENDRGYWAYDRLADELIRVADGKPDKDLKELFSRMVFNCLISNLDDHPRNHAFLANTRGWSLSPAYDLTPTPTIAMERRDLAMSIGKWGRYANKDNLLSCCQRFRLHHDEASALIDQMMETVEKSWYPIAKASGVSEIDCQRIQSSFLYDGFKYSLDSEPDNVPVLGPHP